MPYTRIDLSSYLADVTATAANAIGYIDAAGRAQKQAADKAAAVRVPATLGASEASSAKMIFSQVEAQQGAVLAAGLDPQAVFGGLLNWASTLAQSAKDRLIDAAAASA